MNSHQQGMTLSFGTDGIRGRADQFPFTDTDLFVLGQGIAAWACDKYQRSSPMVLLGMDTRLSSPRIKDALIQGLIHGGLSVLDAGVVPTPVIYKLLMLQEKNEFFCDIGIMITASHNPYHDNGIKIFDANECKISSDDEQIIIQKVKNFSNDNQSTVPIDRRSATQLTTAFDHYQQHLKTCFDADFLKNVKVVLDCAHGAISDFAPAIFKQFGADVHVIAAEPNGKNINDHCGAVYPQYLASVVREVGAYCGFGFDGDGDRIVIVNKYGEVKDGDDILALLTQLPAYSSVQTIVGTVMANQGLEAFFAHQNKKLLRTAVGDKHVLIAMKQAESPLGAEPSGHVILYDYMPTSDGLYVALKVLESVKYNNNWDFITFQKFPHVLVNVQIDHKKDLTTQPFATVIKEHEQLLQGGRLLVRYSGTEPILRVMIEAASHEVASAIAHQLAAKLQKELNENT